jgi:nucleoid-associated protein Lsr2
MITDHQSMNGVCVAQRIETVFIDDLDGSEASTTIRFGLDGAEFEIDLNTAHADELRKTAEPYMQAGRKVTSNARRTVRGGARRSAASGGPASSEVRDWAKDHGYDVKERGRIPAELVVKFQAATNA